MSGVRGGEGERLPGRRMEGRNLRSRSRRGGVCSSDLAPTAEPVGEISGVGDSPSWPSCGGGPVRERSALWKVDLRFLRRRSHSRAKHTSATSASAEHTATAALPAALRVLPDVVEVPAAASSASVVVGVAVADVLDLVDVSVGLSVVVAIGGTVLVGVGRVAVLDCDDEACDRVAVQSPPEPPCVLQVKSAGGGPGSKIEKNPMLA